VRKRGAVDVEKGDQGENPGKGVRESHQKIREEIRETVWANWTSRWIRRQNLSSAMRETTRTFIARESLLAGTEI